MYKITDNNGVEYLSDALRFIKLSDNGCYVSEEVDPSGFVGVVRTDIDGETFLLNKVFVFPGKTMKGDESQATYEETAGAPIIVTLEDDLAQAYELLYGGDA